MPKRIRLAMVRCDTHGYYFGALMARCDPLLLEKHNKIVHFYATDWYDPTNIISPTTDDFERRLAYIIHGIALAINVFGDPGKGAVEWVESMGASPLELMLMTLVKPKSDRSLQVLVNNHASNAVNCGVVRRV